MALADADEVRNSATVLAEHLSRGLRAFARVSIFQNQGEGDEPDEIVGDSREGESRRERALGDRHREPDRPECLAQEPHENDGPVAARIACRDPIAQPIHPHDHAHALPYLGIVRRRHAAQREKQVREQHHGRAPQNVVDGGRPKPCSRPCGRTLFGAGFHGLQPTRLGGEPALDGSQEPMDVSALRTHITLRRWIRPIEIEKRGHGGVELRLAIPKQVVLADFTPQIVDAQFHRGRLLVAKESHDCSV